MRIVVFAIIAAIAYYIAAKIFAIVFWREAVEIIFSAIEFSEVEENAESGRGEL